VKVSTGSRFAGGAAGISIFGIFSGRPRDWVVGRKMRPDPEIADFLDTGETLYLHDALRLAAESGALPGY